jgi:ABC-type sugar transport system ATPase subunit
MTMSDKIVILHDGRIQQVGAPDEIYEKPANIFVAAFIGTPQMNILTKKEMTAIGCVLTGAAPDREELTCGIRPEDLEVSIDPRQGWIEAAVDLCEPAGALTTLTISASGVTLRCSTTLKWPQAQTRAWFTFKREHLHFFSSTDGSRITH